jgi:hypothetical protein
MHKEGAAFRSLMNSSPWPSPWVCSTAPLENLVEQFTFTRFELHGVVSGHPNTASTSIVDYIFRCWAWSTGGAATSAQVKPAEEAPAMKS